jgi:hypothetical protein
MNAGALSASDLREQMVLRASAGEELADIERELIEPAALSEDDKAALWLLAWSHTSDIRSSLAGRLGG